MTDNTTNTNDQQTDTNDQQTDTNDQSTPSFSRGNREKMKDMDHSPPVDGANRTFERNNEARPEQTDGSGRGTGPQPGADESHADKTADESGRDSKPMKEMDHSSPVEGPTRVFERGNELSDVSK